MRIARPTCIDSVTMNSNVGWENQVADHWYHLLGLQNTQK